MAAPLQPRGSTRARCRTVLAEAPSAAAPLALSRRSVLAATEPKLLTPSQTFWTGMSELGLGTRKDGDYARLQDIFEQTGSWLPLESEGRHRPEEPSPARAALAELEAQAAELEQQLWQSSRRFISQPTAEAAQRSLSSWSNRQPASPPPSKPVKPSSARASPAKVSAAAAGPKGGSQPVMSVSRPAERAATPAAAGAGAGTPARSARAAARGWALQGQTLRQAEAEGWRADGAARRLQAVTRGWLARRTHGWLGVARAKPRPPPTPPSALPDAAQAAEGRAEGEATAADEARVVRRVRRVLGSRGADEETLRELLQQMFDLHQATKERHGQELMGRRGAIQ